MNVINIVQNGITARLFALITIVALLLSAFPVAFFVAEAATDTLYTTSSLTVNANSYSTTGDIDASSHENIRLSFDFDATGGEDSADGIEPSDTFKYGYRIGSDSTTEVELGSVPGVSGTGTSEIGSITELSVPAGANNVPNLQFYFTVESGGGTDTVAIRNIVVTGDSVSETPDDIDTSEEVDEVPAVDFCDPAQKPGGKSIAQWHADNQFDGSNCFSYELISQCGTLDVQFNENQTPYDYAFYYVIGSETPELANYEGDGQLPVDFDEDENDGSVDVTYYVTGAEKDYFTGSDVPNIWDGNGETVTVDTDCENDEPELEIPQQCSVVVDELMVPADSSAGADSNVTLDNGRDYFAVVEGTYIFGAPKSGDERVADVEYSLDAGETDWVKEFSNTQPDVLDLFIDGSNPDFGAFRSDHTYGVYFTGTGAVSNFTIEDNPYNDNSGELDVTIYECEPIEKPVCEIGENLLKNASFEEPKVTDNKNWFYTPIVDWVITALSDNEEQDGELHRGWEGNDAAHGEQYAELDSRESVKMSQTVDTIKGATYELKWAFAPRHSIDAEENQLSVLVDGAEVATEGPDTAPAGLASEDWTRSSYLFVAESGETTLSFADIGVSSDTFGTFLDDTALCFVREPEPEPKEPEICSEDGEVVSHTQGDKNNGDPVDASRSDVAGAENGVADYNNFFSKEPSWDTDDFYTLGINGELVYKFTDKIAVDQPGDDIAIWEITGGNSGQSNEKVDVYLSEDGISFELTEQITGDGKVDIADTTLSFVKYVKIVDQSNGVQGGNGDGYDLDAITIIEGSCEEPTPVSDQYADVTMCKEDEQGNDLAGWQLALLGDTVDTLAFAPTAAVQAMSEVPAGNYVIKAEGTYGYGNGGRFADARFSERKPSESNYVGPYLPWVEASVSTQGLAIQVEGESTLWGNVYSPAHVYYGSFTQPALQDIDFSMYDNQYADNSGSIDLTLYQGFTGITGDNGCVVIEDVPYGDYEVAELLQGGFENTSGLGSVVVDEDQETFTVVNNDLSFVPSCELDIYSDEMTLVKETNQTATSTYDGNDRWTASIANAIWVWVTAEVEEPKNDETYTFVETFTVTNPNAGNLTIAHDNWLKLTINDTVIERDQNGYQDFQKYDEDILAALVSGENRIEMEVKNIGTDGSNYLQNPAGALFHIAVTGEGESCARTTEPSFSSLTIDNPALDGTVLSGTTTFAATYKDYDNDEDEVFWAIRAGSCSGTDVVGNAPASPTPNHPSTFNPVTGAFETTVDMSAWDNGDYCLVVNPREDAGAPNERETRTFTLQNSDTQPQTYRISGVKWADDDGDGIYDEAGSESESAEDTISGWVISLLQDGVVVATTTTDGAGEYSFDVEPGVWTISEEAESGWTQTGLYKNGEPVSLDGQVPASCTFTVPEDGQEVDFYTCSFGNQEDEDDTTDTPVDPEIETQSGGGSGSTGTRVRRVDAPTPLVLGATTDAPQFCPFIEDYMQIGAENDAMEVMKLQLFLNIFKDTYGGTENPITGTFGSVTDANVKAFQETYRSEVLDPWFERGIVPHDRPTGYVYKTTLWKINSIVCPDYAVEPDFAGESLDTNVDNNLNDTVRD